MTDFRRTRSLLDLPAGLVYLDGNSLGPLPKAAPGLPRFGFTPLYVGEVEVRGWWRRWPQSSPMDRGSAGPSQAARGDLIETSPATAVGTLLNM